MTEEPKNISMDLQMEGISRALYKLQIRLQAITEDLVALTYSLRRLHNHLNEENSDELGK